MKTPFFEQIGLRAPPPWGQNSAGLPWPKSGIRAWMVTLCGFLFSFAVFSLVLVLVFQLVVPERIYLRHDNVVVMVNTIFYFTPCPTRSRLIRLHSALMLENLALTTRPATHTKPPNTFCNFAIFLVITSAVRVSHKKHEDYFSGKRVFWCKINSISLFTCRWSTTSCSCTSCWAQWPKRLLWFFRAGRTSAASGSSLISLSSRASSARVVPSISARRRCSCKFHHFLFLDFLFPTSCSSVPVPYLLFVTFLFL